MLAKTYFLQKTRRAHIPTELVYKCALRESGKRKNAKGGLPKSENEVKAKGGDFFWIECNGRSKKNTTRP